MDLTPEIETLNKFMVASQLDGTLAVLNVPMHWRGSAVVGVVAPLSDGDAVNLAAWLVALTGKREEFLRLLDAIEAT